MTGQIWEPCAKCGTEPCCAECGSCQKHCQCIAAEPVAPSGKYGVQMYKKFMHHDMETDAGETQRAFIVVYADQSESPVLFSSDDLAEVQADAARRNREIGMLTVTINGDIRILTIKKAREQAEKFQGSDYGKRVQKSLDAVMGA